MTVQDLFDEVSGKVETLAFLAECFADGISNQPGFKADQAINILNNHIQWLNDSVKELGEMVYHAN